MAAVIRLFKCKVICAILTLVLATGGLLASKLAVAQSQRVDPFNPDRPDWTRLLFNGKTFLGKVAVDVELAQVSSDQARANLVASPTGIPICIESPHVGRLTVRRTIDATFRPEITEDDKVWFNLKRASALGRVRTRRGEEDFIKTYRFTDKGVFRLQKEPANQDEQILSPEQWTRVVEKFYGHDLKLLDCPVASERSILLYLASAGDFSDPGRRISVCVFGKRQLHRAQLGLAGVESLAVNYVEKKGNVQSVHQGRTQALKIAMQARPLPSDLDGNENFSFLGLHRNIVFFIDPVSGLPLQISGDLPRLGTMQFKLIEVARSGSAR